MENTHVVLRPVSGLCNYHCEYCFSNRGSSDRGGKSIGLMTLETLEQVIRKTLSQNRGEFNLTFQGGEPMMAGLSFYQKTLEYEEIHNIHGSSVHNVIQTNGSFIDEEWTRFFTANDFSIEVSLDGIKSCHDYYRKDYMSHDTYAATVKRIGLLSRYKADFHVVTAVNDLTSRHAADIYNFYKKKRWNSINLVPCMGEPGQSHILTSEQYGSFLKQLFDLWYEDLQSGRYVYIRYFADLLLLMEGRSPSDCSVCGSCRKQYVVESNGDVYPCSYYVKDKYKLGNLVVDNLEMIDRKREELRFIEASMEKNTECSSCPWYPLCRNGCRRHRETGESLEKTIFCEAYRDFLSYAKERLTECLKI